MWQLTFDKGKNETVERSDQGVPDWASCGDCHILHIGKGGLHYLPVNFIIQNHCVEVHLNNQSLDKESGSLDGNNSDDSHWAVKFGVKIDSTEVKSQLWGPWNVINPSLIDVKSVYVNFVNIDAISEATLRDL